MSTGNWTMLHPVSYDEDIRDTDWNAEFQNVINNSNPDGLGSASENIPAMQATRDPFTGEIPQLALSTRDELESIRYQLNLLIGKTYWYERPIKSIEDIENEIIVIEGETVDGGNDHDHTGVGPNGGGALIGTDAIADNSLTTDKYQDGSVTQAKLDGSIIIPTGILQLQEVTTNAQTTFSGHFDADNDIPTWIASPNPSFSDLLLTLPFTPQKSGSTVLISCEVNYQIGSAGEILTLALFVDGSPGSNAVVATGIGGEDLLSAGFVGFKWISPDTNPHTFTLRSGVTFGNYTINKNYGGVSICFLRAMEIG